MQFRHALLRVVVELRAVATHGQWRLRAAAPAIGLACAGRPPASTHSGPSAQLRRGSFAAMARDGRDCRSCRALVMYLSWSRQHLGHVLVPQWHAGADVSGGREVRELRAEWGAPCLGPARPPSPAWCMNSSPTIWG